jgi:hypothetical protein
MLITEKYTMVMATVFGGMNLMKNISSPLPDVKTHPITNQECLPNNVFYTATREEHYFKGMFLFSIALKLKGKAIPLQALKVPGR